MIIVAVPVVELFPFEDKMKIGAYIGSFFFFFFFLIIRWFDSSFSIMCAVEFGEQEVGSCCFELALSLFLGLVETSRRAPKEQNLWRKKEG